MKILYNILNPAGLGADRWIGEGYRAAFRAAGHEFFTVTEWDDFEDVARRARPDFVFLDFLPFRDYCRRRKDVPPEFFRDLRSDGSKVFCMTTVGIDREEDAPEDVSFFRKYLPVIDACFCNYTPETTRGFRQMYGREIHFVPHAADTSRFFPERPEEKFRCDIAFVGNFYAAKRTQFESLLLPLFGKYRVQVYGSSWTLGSRLLRLASGAARRAHLPRLAEFFYRRRMTLSTDDERKLYASAKICVNIHEYYRDGTTKGFSNEREFKVPASGGFEITDYVPGMERYFTLGEEVVTTKSAQEWFAQIDYYLAHEAERKKIQEAGTARVLREHTYSHRVKQLLDLYHSIPKRS